jgi:alcohol dehydrogenase, propanol-preferring
MSPIHTLDYDREVFGERVIRSVTANTRQDRLGLLREAVAIPNKPHTVRVPLEQANRALQELKTGSFQGAAVLTI